MYKFLILIFAFVTACTTGGHKYSEYSDIPQSGWSYGEPCTYTVKIAPDSTATGMLLISVTHDNSYEYSNLWVETTYTDHGKTVTDTANIILCDNYGNWYGSGLPGHYQFTDTLVHRPVTLTDSSTIQVRHIMRTDTLTGLTQVGISLCTP